MPSLVDNVPQKDYAALARQILKEAQKLKIESQDDFEGLLGTLIEKFGEHLDDGKLNKLVHQQSELFDPFHRKLHDLKQAYKCILEEMDEEKDSLDSQIKNQDHMIDQYKQRQEDSNYKNKRQLKVNEKQLEQLQAIRQDLINIQASQQDDNVALDQTIKQFQTDFYKQIDQVIVNLNNRDSNQDKQEIRDSKLDQINMLQSQEAFPPKKLEFSLSEEINLWDLDIEEYVDYPSMDTLQQKSRSQLEKMVLEEVKMHGYYSISQIEFKYKGINCSNLFANYDKETKSYKNCNESQSISKVWFDKKYFAFQNLDHIIKKDQSRLFQEYLMRMPSFQMIPKIV